MNLVKSFVLLVLAIALPSFGANESLFRDLEKLARHGDAEAQYHLGMFYNNGIGTGQNTKLAYEWFQKSAAGNDPLGNYKLGCYYSGQGRGVVEDDHEKALHYKLVAAKAGYALAQQDVAAIYYQSGKLNEAVYWLKQAGDQGMLSALHALYSLYYKGDKIEKDFYSAYLYLGYAIKSANAPPPAVIKQAEEDLTNKLTPALKKKADEMVAGWNPKPTLLTLKAMSGLKVAEDYANRHKGR